MIDAFAIHGTVRPRPPGIRWELVAVGESGRVLVASRRWWRNQDKARRASMREQYVAIHLLARQARR